MNKMMEAPDLPSLNANQVNHQLLELTFNIATRYLQTKVCSYVWDKCANYDNWKVSTWSKKVKFSEIMKNGNDSDKLNLPEENRFNRKRKKID
jgi:hypothetical protein